VEFRENALTRNELARILNRNAVRIRRVGNKLPSGNRWHIEIPFHRPRSLSRVIRRLERLPGVAVSAREKGLPS
jgi:hypothetical protein